MTAFRRVKKRLKRTDDDRGGTVCRKSEKEGRFRLSNCERLQPGRRGGSSSSVRGLDRFELVESEEEEEGKVKVAHLFPQLRRGKEETKCSSVV